MLENDMAARDERVRRKRFVDETVTICRAMRQFTEFCAMARRKI